MNRSRATAEASTRVENWARPGVSSKITDLRALLVERFPNSSQPNSSQPFCAQAPSHTKPTTRKTLPTGIPEWDAQTDGLRLGEVTEVCGRLGGTALLIDTLLEGCAAAGWRGAWVDAGDALEVEDWPDATLRQMVWVRCRDAMMALKSADLLLRDGNLSWVILDLQGLSPTALRKISGTYWHRFHRVVEHHKNALLVLSTSPIVEGVKVRVVSSTACGIESLTRERKTLRGELGCQVFVRGRMQGAPFEAGETALDPRLSLKRSA